MAPPKPRFLLIRRHHGKAEGVCQGLSRSRRTVQVMRLVSFIALATVPAPCNWGSTETRPDRPSRRRARLSHKASPNCTSDSGRGSGGRESQPASRVADNLRVVENSGQLVCSPGQPTSGIGQKRSKHQTADTAQGESVSFGWLATHEQLRMTYIGSSGKMLKHNSTSRVVPGVTL